MDYMDDGKKGEDRNTAINSAYTHMDKSTATNINTKVTPVIRITFL